MTIWFSGAGAEGSCIFKMGDIKENFNDLEMKRKFFNCWLS